ncbi:Rv1535 domain-containing protein [Mycolicibacterium celeriflavum]|uniref:Rv1535 domain-containing protein n=1 Tax=Mycolicibacterium celeriflavum TaxID=1249101 RepID=UPI001F335084|nr:Rv1535 domain-containing protein [Mycolicibacterium celeriflavum]
MADSLDGIAVGCGVSRGFGHSLPSRHGVFDVWTPDVWTVGGVSPTGVKTCSDPLTVVSGLITIPLRELYAVLWRIGVVDIED